MFQGWIEHLVVFLTSTGKWFYIERRCLKDSNASVRTSAVCYILREMELERVLPYFRRLFFPWTRRRWKIFLISFASVGCPFEVPHLVVFNGVGFPFLLSNQILMLNKWWHNWAELFSDFCPSFETTTAYWCFRTTCNEIATILLYLYDAQRSVKVWW